MTRRKTKGKRVNIGNVDPGYAYDKARCDSLREVSDLKQSVRYMNHGSERRKLILRIAAIDGIPVNRKWCMSMRRDPDLRKLVKEGKLLQTRGRISGGVGMTVLKSA